jgi:hypothetical protein
MAKAGENFAGGVDACGTLARRWGRDIDGDPTFSHPAQTLVFYWSKTSSETGKAGLMTA